jgi:hypothetical protein
MQPLELSDRLDLILINRDKIRPILHVVVHDDIGQADELPGLLVNRIRDAMTHWRDEKVTHVGTADSTNADANFLALGHGILLPPGGLSLAFTAKKFLAPAQLLILVLAHFFPAFFQHTRHTSSLLGAGV